jgi:hypothetical protein
MAFVAAAMLAGLAACSQPTPAPAPAAAGGAASGAYTLDLIPASAQYGDVVVRMATATGQSTLSSGDPGGFVPVTEAAAPPAGAYRLYHFVQFDGGATTREWEIYRLEANSGRTWYLKYDGAKTASWIELLAVQ